MSRRVPRGTRSARGPRAMSVVINPHESDLAAETVRAKPKRAGLTRTERADRRFSILMIAPAFTAVIAIMGYPWFYSLWLSLHSMNLLTKRWTWVGLGNYRTILPDETFTSSLVRTLWFSGIVVVGGTVLGLLMAMVLGGVLVLAGVLAALGRRRSAR